jgi:hypothetical protein
VLSDKFGISSSKHAQDGPISFKTTGTSRLIDNAASPPGHMNTEYMPNPAFSSSADKTLARICASAEDQLSP